jgi:hypothetical protein
MIAGDMSCVKNFTLERARLSKAAERRAGKAVICAQVYKEGDGGGVVGGESEFFLGAMEGFVSISRSDILLQREFTLSAQI